MKAAFAAGGLWRLRCPIETCGWLSRWTFTITDQFAGIGHASAELFGHLREEHLAIYVRVDPS